MRQPGQSRTSRAPCGLDPLMILAKRGASHPTTSDTARAAASRLLLGRAGGSRQAGRGPCLGVPAARRRSVSGAARLRASRARALSRAQMKRRIAAPGRLSTVVSEDALSTACKGAKAGAMRCGAAPRVSPSRLSRLPAAPLALSAWSALAAGRVAEEGSRSAASAWA
eukprot:scaffold9107_cov112-Isochrysis_galbana.AAC.6